MSAPMNTAAYRFLAEVLLYPEDRDVGRLELCAEEAGTAAPEWRGVIQGLMNSPGLNDCDVYLEAFEIGAKCPLYLGHYLFAEPTNCRGAAVSGRNAYMIQLKNLYRHFGLELQGRELPDYLPLMLDFLALTAGHPADKHRRLLVRQFMLPALPALSKALREPGNVYSPIAGLLEELLPAEVPPESGVRAPSGENARPHPEAFTTSASPVPRAQRGPDAGRSPVPANVPSDPGEGGEVPAAAGGTPGTQPDAIGIGKTQT